jgi:lambda repressor-like predicted transcriptional regulator
MKELEDLKDWLRSRAGSWRQISRKSGVSTRTIHRILNNTGYSVNLKTFAALNRERERLARLEAFEATL